MAQGTALDRLHNYPQKLDENESPDNMAFNNMQKATSNNSDKMFTESEYNINATHKERMSYDKEAYKFMQKMFQEDQAKNPDIKDWDFDRYLKNVSSSYLSEKFTHSRKGDPDFYSKAGDMLRSVYSDDVDQLKLSARNVSAQISEAYKPNLEKDDYKERAKAARDRSNVSIKAPEAEQY